MATIKAKAASLDIEVEAGATFDTTLTWKDKDGVPVDLTGYSAEMHIRDSVDSDIILDTLTTANTRLELGDALGTIRIIIPDSVSTAYTFSGAVYDLEITSAVLTKRRLFEGSISVIPEVTR